MIYQKIHSNFRPTYAKSLHNRLYDSDFLQEYGNIIRLIIDSTEYWNKLRQRVDYLVYSFVLKHSSKEEVSPTESDPLNVDSLFELVEQDMKRLDLDYEAILIDELFRSFTRCIKGNFVYSDTHYDYFTAPYFSSEIYGDYPDQGTSYLDNLTEELFDEPLEVLIESIKKRVDIWG
ncbi:hypothetical protein DS745_15570 [Anaerobacillus alkaliphilus]|uniref:Uncharacterized protein n=1 Tax=Anaerobacillus alkaliphilus TaxID=1548597 RepID=A0A4Q0VPF6_9BACI|nr:hypothetical protein [Anaerobacillus alkaliphilus]RXI97785.1 hypothetical protein DS745_15570 [Anaerobacillus alkaliphilus]